MYAISTGAMFASGFFLLPGIAAANAGPAVVLAYALSSLLMLPAMFSIAELSSAMPRAAGTYFFIHRSLGPWAGTIGGFGDWLVLSFKSAFALVGMGAYLVLFFDVPMVPLAVALVVAFGALNIVGAKETAWLQKVLVVTLVTLMAYYVTQGLVHLTGEGLTRVHATQFDPFMPFGVTGLASTIGIVFISYAGLTKVAAAAEEIRDLDRNLPLGMFLALGTVGAIYVGGVYVMVGSIDPAALRDDLTPVATAGEAFLGWLPEPVGLILVVVAAIAAFASTGNAGILTASRYPLAMARDELVWSRFDNIGRFGTPTLGIIATCGVMVAAIVFLDVERLATLGSAFLLLIFALINLSVIIMRESRIEAYAPGFRSPLYPWMQIVGALAMFGLLATLGWFYVVFVLTVIALASIWYVFYARGRVAKRGAIYNLFARLAKQGDPGLDLELWRLLQERGTSDEDSYEELVARAHVIDMPGPVRAEDAIERVSGELAETLDLTEEELADAIADALDGIVTPAGGSTALFETLVDGLDRPELVLVRVPEGVPVGTGQEFPGQGHNALPEDEDEDADADPDETDGAAGGPDDEPDLEADALVFLISPADRMTQHLRILAELATQVDEADFHPRWLAADDESAIKEVLLRHERFLTIELRSEGPSSKLIGQRIRDLHWPSNSLIALIRRDRQSIFPRGGTRLREGDRLTIIGPPDDVQEMYERYRTNI